MAFGGFVPGQHLVEAYGAGGFRFAGMSHRGAILALPSGVHAWSGETTREGLAPLFALARGEVETLLLGTGAALAPVAADLRWALREAGIAVEAMQTGPAARTYNIMAGERRRVAAALAAVP